jgi:hypothetical protein
MKLLLLLFALFFARSVFGQTEQEIQRTTSNFTYEWANYLLPDSPFLIYHGKDKSYFVDSNGRRVPNHAYLDIRTGGKSHFIVQTAEGFHLLNAQLERVTEKPYTNIQLIDRSQLKLTIGERTTFYEYDHAKRGYIFTDIPSPVLPAVVPMEPAKVQVFGNVTDARFKAKRIEQLRLGIDMSQTLTTEQKGKNILVKKGETIFYKGPTKPMLFYDFAIAGEKGPYSVYHPISKEPLLENCERFWCVGSFLVVAIKGNLRKHVVSNTGEIILTSAGEIRYYEYEYGGRNFAFFCDGRSVVNLNGDLIYKSDGDLIGVGEHYIYSGYTGAYLGDLSHTVKMDCSSLDRYETITIGQTGRNEYRAYNVKSVMIDKVNNYYIDKHDSVVVCVTDSKTFVCNPFTGQVIEIYPVSVEARTLPDYTMKYFITKMDANGTVLKGRFDPKRGRLANAEYLNIEWPPSEKYHVVVTTDGKIRYLDKNGQKLFD